MIKRNFWQLDSQGKKGVAKGIFLICIAQLVICHSISFKETLWNLAPKGHAVQKNTIPLSELESVLILDRESSTWGEAIVTLPILVVSSIRSCPNLKEVIVMTHYPELVDPEFLRDTEGVVIKVISPKEWNSGKKDRLNLEGDPYHQLSLDLSYRVQNHPISLPPGTFPPSVNLQEVIQSLMMKHYETRQWITQEEKVILGLRHMGFTVPRVSDPLFKRSQKSKNKGAIFVNLWSRTNVGSFYELRSAWLTLISWLLSNGQDVVLNAGEYWNSLQTKKLISEIQAGPMALGNPPIGQMGVIIEVRKFTKVGESPEQARRDFLTYYANEVKAVVTIDSGPFHLARKFGIPTWVIMTENSRGWVVPADNLTPGYTSIMDTQFSTLREEDFNKPQFFQGLLRIGQGEDTHPLIYREISL